MLESRGTVRPRTETILIPEVAGTIIIMSPSFQEGGFFEKGDVLLKIDPLNYETAITVSKAALAQAQTMIVEETARAVQAVENWKRLGKTRETRRSRFEKTPACRSKSPRRCCNG